MTLFIEFVQNLNPWVFWLIIALMFLVAEAVSEALLSIWFTVGALVAMVLALLGAPFWSQIVAMLVASGILLVIFVKNRDKMRLTSPFKVATNADRVVGEHAEVTQTIDPIQGTGQVKVRGIVWSAVTEHDTPIPSGTYVLVREIRGVKLLVEALEPTLQ